MEKSQEELSWGVHFIMDCFRYQVSYEGNDTSQCLLSVMVVYVDKELLVGYPPTKQYSPAQALALLASKFKGFRSYF